MIYRPGDPEPCRVHATQQATETNPILHNLRKLITNPNAAISEEPETKVSKESQLVEKKSDIQPDVVKVTITKPSKPTSSPFPTPPENGNIGMFESSFLTNMMQEIAAPFIGNTGGDDGIDQTETVADSTNRADNSDNASQEKLMADTSDKADDSGNVGQEKKWLTRLTKLMIQTTSVKQTLWPTSLTKLVIRAMQDKKTFLPRIQVMVTWKPTRIISWIF